MTETSPNNDWLDLPPPIHGGDYLYLLENGAQAVGAYDGNEMFPTNVHNEWGYIVLFESPPVKWKNL